MMTEKRNGIASILITAGIVMCLAFGIFGTAIFGTGAKADGYAYLIKDGKTAYKVVTPAASTSATGLALGELTALWYDATGIVLEEVNETEIESLPASGSIVLGNTKFTRAAGVSATYEALGNEGYTVKTADGNVYITGFMSQETDAAKQINGDYGTVYGVYEFMNRVFGYEFFYNGIYNIEKNVREKILPEINVTERPDVDVRLASYGFNINDAQSSARFRLRSWFDYFIPVGGMLWHNTLAYLPVSENKNTHPKWYNDGKFNQLCYTAHGDKDEYNAMTDEVARVVYEKLVENPQKSIITFTHTDRNDWCECATCSAWKKDYGADSAAVVALCNIVAEKVDMRWKAEHDGKARENGFEIVFFAYKATRSAPTVKTVTAVSGDTVSLDCGEHVCCWYADSDLDSHSSLDAAHNLSFKTNINDWKDFCDKIYLWTYHTNYHYYLAPYDGVQYISEYVDLIKNNNVTMWLAQGQQEQGGTSTAFNIFFNYLFANLAWDTDLSVSELTEKFFDAMYKSASQTMQTYYNEYRAWFAHLESEGKYVGNRSIFADPLHADWWPETMLERWLGYTNKALAETEHMKNSSYDAWLATHDAIIAERIMIEYLIYECHETDYADIAKLKAQLKSDIQYLKLTHLSEQSRDNGRDDLKDLVDRLN